MLWMLDFQTKVKMEQARNLGAQKSYLCKWRYLHFSVYVPRAYWLGYLTEDDEEVSGSKRLTSFAKRDPSDYFLSADVHNNGVSDLDPGMTWADNIEQFIQSRENSRVKSACQNKTTEQMANRGNITRRAGSCAPVASFCSDESQSILPDEKSTLSDLLFYSWKRTMSSCNNNWQPKGT